MYKCRECGRETEDNIRFDNGDTLLLKKVCFGCNYWLERIEVQDDLRSVVMNGWAYWIGKEEDEGFFRGSDGEKFHLKFFDGREVKTTNLWCNGEIPTHFIPRLPNNCVRERT